MFLLDLNPKEKRKKIHNIFQIGNVEANEDSISDPDFYIIYRVGCDVRWMSIIFGGAVFLLCIFKHVLSNDLEIPDQANVSLLESYLAYVNYSGILAVLILVRYFVIYKKHVRFAEYSPLRQGIPNYDELISSHKIFIPLIWVAAFMISVKPSLVMSIFYLDIFNGFFEQFFNSTVFLFIAYILIAISHSIFCQTLFKVSVVFTYYLYKARKK